MRYSIITPTILRPSLKLACESVNLQTNTDWEHIVMVDCLGDAPAEIFHPQRRVLYCMRQHKNWGNTCRHMAWYQAKGEYIIYLDDDNYFADTAVLETLQVVKKDWAIFPMLKVMYGGFYFHCPPMRGFTDAGQMIIKREIAQYPDIADYDADGILAESLRKYPMDALLGRPLLVKPTK